VVDVPKLIVAISSRALFDLTESHQIFEEQGIEAYCKYQIDNEEVPLNPGVAYPLVTKLLDLNKVLDGKASVEVILLSRNSADTGLRIFNSIEHHDLTITRAAFTGGENPFAYVAALGAQLFLSADSEDVSRALEAGIAAATLVPSKHNQDRSGCGGVDELCQLRIAFDGDAVIFSDEAEQVYRSGGLEVFEASERASAHAPLSGGPFKPFLSILHQLQSILPPESALIRTALITARGAPAHERVIRTLRAWNIRIDEALFLAGMDKGKFLDAFEADIFFDDQKVHCDSASQHVPTGHVPHGIANR
jgi:5'-nucleotidase